ncbi:urea transporter [Catellatospora methionotrophica]|uniref:urea transporter n=1 Tax=Catellatospora methionotrophica TaxID=121620 RepID=UPI0033EDE68C
MTGTTTAARSAHPARAFIDTNLRGAGQVMFMNNPITGALILIAVGWGAIAARMPQVAIGAVVGLIAGTLTAMALRVDTDSLRQGLYGFSPLLTGAAVPTFLDDTPLMWTYLIIGAATTTVVTLALTTVFNTWRVPALTFPFVLTSWFLMLAAYQFRKVSISSLAQPMLPKPVSGDRLDMSAADLATSMLKGVAQVFLIDNWVSGLIILVALAVNSRWAAALAAVGTIVATLLAAGLGADATSVTAGLYGFSAVLTAVALGCVFYHPTWPVLLYALLGTVFTVFVQAALNTALAPIGIPSFTAPFVFATWLFLLPKRDLTPTPHHRHIDDGVIAGTHPKA